MGRMVCSLWVCLAWTACGFDPGGTSGIDDDDPMTQAPDGGLVPTSDWWRADYAHRRPIVVTAKGTAVPEGASVYISTDTAALIAASDVLESGADFRIVYQGGGEFVELDRWIDDGEGGGWASSDTRAWFRVMTDIAASSADANTYLYFDNAAETDTPPADLLGVFLFGDDFETDMSLWQPNDRGEQIAIQQGVVRAGASALELGGNDTRVAGVHRDQALPMAALEFSHYLRQSQTGASFGNFRTFEIPFAQRSPTWLEDGVRSHGELDSGDRFEFVTIEPFGRPAWASPVGTGWHRLTYVHDLAANENFGVMDEGAPSKMYPDYDASSLPIASFALEGEGEGGVFQIDNYLVRLHIDPAPIVTLGDLEDAP